MNCFAEAQKQAMASRKAEEAKRKEAASRAASDLMTAAKAIMARHQEVSPIEQPKDIHVRPSSTITRKGTEPKGKAPASSKRARSPVPPADKVEQAKKSRVKATSAGPSKRSSAEAASSLAPVDESHFPTHGLGGEGLTVEEVENSVMRGHGRKRIPVDEEIQALRTLVKGFHKDASLLDGSGSPVAWHEGVVSVDTRFAHLGLIMHAISSNTAYH